MYVSEMYWMEWGSAALRPRQDSFTFNYYIMISIWFGMFAILLHRGNPFFGYGGNRKKTYEVYTSIYLCGVKPRH